MGRKGVLSSAAAGGSLIAASIVLVIGVASIIGFRGFDSADVVAEEESVVIERAADAREAGASAKPATAVLGSARTARQPRRASRRKPAKAASPRRTSRKPARAGLSAPVRKPAPATPAAPAAQAPPAPQATPEQKTTPAPAAPAEDLVEDVTGVVEDATKKPVESVGDVLLDVRDLLP